MALTPIAGRTHNCVLRYGAPGATTDVGLMLPDGNLKFWQTQPYTPFAPAARQGEATNKDFSVTAVWEIHQDFSGGILHIAEKIVESGDYQFAQGRDLAGSTTLGACLFSGKRKSLLPAPAEVSAGSIGAFKKFIQFSDGWYAVTNATPGVIYKWDAGGTTPSAVETLTAACTDLFTDGATLYACQGASNVVRTTTDGATWADAAYNANCLCQRDENIVVYVYGNTLVPGTGYPDTVSVGWTGTTVNSMVYFDSALWFGKPEGLYCFRNGRISFVFPVQDQYNAANFTKMTVHQGLLYFNVQNHLFFSNGQGKFVEVYPEDTNGFDSVDSLFATFGPMLIGAKMHDADGTARNYLLLFDGPDHPGFNPLWSDAAGDRTVNGCGATNVFDTTKVRLYFSQATTGEKYLDFNVNYEPNTSHVKGTNAAYITTTTFSAGFRTVKKWFYEVVLNVRNPDSTTFATVEYSIDGGAFAQTQDYAGAAHTLALNASSVGTYFPLNTTGTNVQLRITLWTTQASSPAEISHLTMRGLAEVKPRYQIAFPVDCSENVAPLQGGAAESGEAIRAQIIAASDQGYPCKLQDPWGNWHLVTFRPPAPYTEITGYATPTGNAPERIFSTVRMALMEIDALGTDGALQAWTPG